jgi:hypothetical protein
MTCLICNVVLIAGSVYRARSGCFSAVGNSGPLWAIIALCGFGSGLPVD